MPFLIGGAGEKVTLRLVAEHAQMWHSFGDLEVYQRKAEILAEHCATVGRDPSEIARVWGTQKGLLEQADGLADAGVDELCLGVGGNGTGYDLGQLRELVQWRDARGD
jgi:alkanesulfonate monooxygenase SsuD/methylene tetrahydromethanopterin reductase-like flavin-dependent oxidoreductase (luciferase family)